VQLDGVAGRTARVIEVDVVFDQRVIGLVKHLVPGYFGSCNVQAAVHAYEVAVLATAVAVAAVNVLGRVVADGQGLRGGAVAAPLVDVDARGLLEVVVLDDHRLARVHLDKAAVAGVVGTLGEAVAPVVAHNEGAAAILGVNQVAGTGQDAVFNGNGLRGLDADSRYVRVGAAIVAGISAALRDNERAGIGDIGRLGHHRHQAGYQRHKG